MYLCTEDYLCLCWELCVCVCTCTCVCACVHILVQGALCAHTRPTDKPRLERGSGGSVPAPRWVPVEEKGF